MKRWDQVLCDVSKICVLISYLTGRTRDADIDRVIHRALIRLFTLPKRVG